MKLFGWAVFLFLIYCVGIASGCDGTPTKEDLKCDEEFWKMCQDQNGVRAPSDEDPECQELCLSQKTNGAEYRCFKDIPHCLDGSL
uniref:Uncharacterized protein n=1 Tax=Ditylenchus dipsaci TaxID=166011 RepID=A0A915EP24_9BILA